MLFCIAGGQDVFPLGGSSLRNSDLPVTYYLLIGCVPMKNLGAICKTCLQNFVLL